MPSRDLKARFDELYEQEVHDPVLTALLRSLEGYQEDLQTDLLLSVYPRRHDEIGDAYAEVLARHLFGQMFPGPVFAVAYASLKDQAPPQRLERHHYFSMQDPGGNPLLFAPQHPCWLVPGKKDVVVDSAGDRLRFVFDADVRQMEGAGGRYACAYIHDADPLLIERLRCRLAEQAPELEDTAAPPTVLRERYPGRYDAVDEFFSTPYAERFLKIPFALLKNAPKKAGEGVWLEFQGLGGYAGELRRRVTLNAFVAWNMYHEVYTPLPDDRGSYAFSLQGSGPWQTIVTHVEDRGPEPPVVYEDASVVLDPGYPYQYTASVDVARAEVRLAFSPPPQGSVSVRVHRYHLGPSSVGMPAGTALQYHRGLPEQVRTASTLVPTHRLEALSDRNRLWAVFRSLLASRNRWLTRDDLRAAVLSFPAFAGGGSPVRREGITFEEKVGRVRGFLTPFTEITIPVTDRSLLGQPDLGYFQRRVGKYIKSRTVNGNFVRARLVPAEGT